MLIQSWTTFFASSTPDLNAMTAWWQPLLNNAYTPIFVVGGITLLIGVLLLLVHGRRG